MPSIPQSLLWVSLVVLWLFVLVPMLISKREAVRRTSDVALATRVLNSAAGARLLKRGGPAAGHRSDPDWCPEPEEDADVDDRPDHEGLDEPSPARSMVMRAAAVDEPESAYLDVDVVEEDSGALPVGRSAQTDPPLSAVHDDDDAAGLDAEDDLTDRILLGDAARDEADVSEFGDEADAGDDTYEYVEDTSGLEPEEEPATTVTPGGSRRRRYDSTTAEVISARKYTFRKRVLMVMALVLAVSAVTAFTMSPAVWWVCGGASGVTVLYLAYLRRQTRIEEQVRRRRAQRVARSRLGVENTRDREFEVVPSRLRRPGAVVLEIDDEDPVFEHLDDVSFARDYDLPRAAGQ